MADFNSFDNGDFGRRRAMRPTKRTWFKHACLLLLTFITSTIAGVVQPFGVIKILPELDSPEISGITDALLMLPVAYLNLILTAVYNLVTNPEMLTRGLTFSVSLLFILTAHEAGHYIACRIYRVDATLPYFIPTPVLIGPAGTLGAFIKILSPMPSRRAVFDIGVAGPIAGFIALLPVAALAIATTEYAEILPVGEGEFQMEFSNPLIFSLFAYFGGFDLNMPILPNPFYFAAWLGMLITALNLIPSGQLDGGHAIYAVFGKRVHHWTGRIAFVSMAILSVLGWYFFGSPSGFLFALILAIMLRIKHPAPIDTAPLDFKRKIVALITLIIFVLCFVPFPIKLS